MLWIYIYLAGCLIISGIVTGIVLYTRKKDKKEFGDIQKRNNSL